MRYLALDVGDERIGVAISDELGLLARPLQIIARRSGPSSFEHLARLVAQYGVERIVVGLPLLMDGSEGQQVQSTRAYVRGLQAHIQLPILYWDERLSTQQALQVARQRGRHRPRRPAGANRGPKPPVGRADDAVAAAVILQEFLDAQTNPADEPARPLSQEGHDS